MKIINKILLFIYILFIVLSIYNPFSFAADYNFKEVPIQVIDIRNTSEYYNNINYDWLIYKWDADLYTILFIEKSDTLKFYITDKVTAKYSGYWFISNELFSGYLIELNTDFSIRKSETYTNADWTIPYRGGFVNSDLCCASSFNIYTDNTYTSIFLNGESRKYIFPYIADTDEELMNMTNNSYVLIFPGDIPETNTIKFSITQVDNNYGGEEIFSLELNSYSPLYKYNSFSKEYWYEVPTNSFIDLLNKNNNYLFTLSGNNDYTEFSESRAVFFTGLSFEDRVEDKIDKGFSDLSDILDKSQQQSQQQYEQSMQQSQQQHDEAQETRKGILASIKEVVSFLNPLSENFFVYKLIDLLIDAIKSLFIPGDNFFSEYFDELFNWFSERLGFLSYPLELILDVLNRFLHINFSEPVINIPTITEPLTGSTLISSTSFNFNSLLENETLKNVHDLYLILVDAVIIFGLVNLLKNKMEEVMTK